MVKQLYPDGNTLTRCDTVLPEARPWPSSTFIVDWLLHVTQWPKTKINAVFGIKELFCAVYGFTQNGPGISNDY